MMQVKGQISSGLSPLPHERLKRRTSVLTPTIMSGWTPSMTSGFPPLPMALMRPSLTPISACKQTAEVVSARDHTQHIESQTNLVDSSPVDDQSVGDDQVQALRVLLVGGLSLSIPQRFSTSELALVTVDGLVVLDLDPESGVTEPDAVSRRRPVHARVW